MGEPIAGIGDEAVENATGKRWAHWLDLLDDADGTDIDHKARVAVLGDAGVESGWWQQQLAVGYEQVRGLRAVGETADAGYQVGVQRTIQVPQETLWDRLTTGDLRNRWLGTVEGFAFEPGATFETAEGTSGEVRTVSEGERLRITWHPAGREHPTTLQMTLSCPRNDETKTTLRVHHEKLVDAAERDAMKAHWQQVLDSIQAAFEG